MCLIHYSLIMTLPGANKRQAFKFHRSSHSFISFGTFHHEDESLHLEGLTAKC